MAGAASEKPCVTQDDQDALATFVSLAKEYKFVDSIAKKMVDALEFRTFADFRYSVTDEKEIGCLLYTSPSPRDA